MMLRFIVAALVVAIAHPVFAGDVACPDLSAAVQVEPCPGEDELRYTYKGFCSDNARLYAKDLDTCASYENYRKVKNIALWESAGGEFQAYVSCDLPPPTVKAARAQRISVGKAGKVTRVACEYGEGIVFAHRTRAACTVDGDGACAGGNCKAICE